MFISVDLRAAATSEKTNLSPSEAKVEIASAEQRLSRSRHVWLCWGGAIKREIHPHIHTQQ
jgi:hypothetical protein